MDNTFHDVDFAAIDAAYAFSPDNFPRPLSPDAAENQWDRSLPEDVHVAFHEPRVFHDKGYLKSLLHRLKEMDLEHPDGNPLYHAEGLPLVESLLFAALRQKPQHTIGSDSSTTPRASLDCGEVPDDDVATKILEDQVPSCQLPCSTVSESQCQGCPGSKEIEDELEKLNSAIEKLEGHSLRVKAELLSVSRSISLLRRDPSFDSDYDQQSDENSTSPQMGEPFQHGAPSETSMDRRRRERQSMVKDWLTARPWDRSLSRGPWWRRLSDFIFSIRRGVAGAIAMLVGRGNPRRYIFGEGRMQRR